MRGLKTFLLIFTAQLWLSQASPLLSTIAEMGSSVVEREMEEVGWYCYKMDTLLEEGIAASQLAIFAAGDNKEGKTIKLGNVSVVSSDGERTGGGEYCVTLENQLSDQIPLTPNDKKISYTVKDSFKFYSLRVVVRDPFSVLAGFNRLKSVVTKLGLESKVDFNRTGVIYTVGDAGAEVLYTQN